MIPFALPFRSAALAAPARVKLLTIVAAALALHPAPVVFPTPLDISPAQAASALKSAASAALKQLKADLQVAKQTFLSDVAAYEAGVQEGLDIATQTGELFTKCAVFQLAVQDAANDSLLTIVGVAKNKLSELANGAMLDGTYPKDFYFGSGGTLDKARRDVKTHLDKLYKSLAGRLHKTAGVLQKFGVTLTLELGPPRYIDDYSISEGSIAAPLDRFGFDIVLAVNHSAVAEDGRVWIGGAAYSDIPEISVNIFGLDFETATATPSAGRWSVALTDGGTLLKKGNYVTTIKGAGDAGTIGSLFSLR
jgi:hypothetical protein